MKMKKNKLLTGGAPLALALSCFLAAMAWAVLAGAHSGDPVGATDCLECHKASGLHPLGFGGFHDGQDGSAPDTVYDNGTGSYCVPDNSTYPDNGTWYVAPLSYGNETACSDNGSTWITHGIKTAGCRACHTAGRADNASILPVDMDPASVGDNATVLSVNEVCLRCHSATGLAHNLAAMTLTADEASVYGNDYHRLDQSSHPINNADNGTSAAYARINWYRGEGCNEIRVDGSMNNHGVGCAWSTADNATIDDNGTTCSTVIHFQDPGLHSITLTMESSATRTIWVNATGNSYIPTVVFTATTKPGVTGDQTGMTALVVDASSSNACGNDNDSGIGTILWGDGGVSQIGTGESDNHTYANDGTYRISYTWRDYVNGRKAIAVARTVTVPDVTNALFRITGTVYQPDNATGQRNVNVLLIQDDMWLRNQDTDDNGTYNFYNVPPLPDNETYTVLPMKNGYTFTPWTVNATGGVVTHNFQAQPDPAWQ